MEQDKINDVAAEEIVENPKRKRNGKIYQDSIKKYRQKTYTRIYAELPKELVAEFKAIVAEKGTSVAKVFKKAMERYIEDNTSKMN